MKEKIKMKKRRVVAVIPARMASSRFPGKPLVQILDLPMIEHVRRRVELSDVVDEVVVATCDQEIRHVVEKNGGKVVMTSDTHQRCTDRVEEAMRFIQGDIVVIISGDEPLFDPSVLPPLVNPMLKEASLVCVNVVSVLRDEKAWRDKDNVKVLLDVNGYILAYSRAPIPFVREVGPCPLYRQTGLAAFTKGFLVKFSQMSPTPLEKVESVDFMRILEHRYPILGIVCDHETVGVDQKEHVLVVEKILREDKHQRIIYEQILKHKDRR